MQASGFQKKNPNKQAANPPSFEDKQFCLWAFERLDVMFVVVFGNPFFLGLFYDPLIPLG